MRTAEKMMIGMKMHENPGKLASEDNDQSGGEQEGEELLKELGQDARHGKLHAFDVVDDCGNRGSGRVLLKKRGGAPQD